METKPIYVSADCLKRLCVHVFEKLGEKPPASRIIADVLLAADLRGIDSHGVARLGMYTEYTQAGIICPGARAEIVRESPTTAVIDAGGGFGQPVSYMAMQMAIEKAKTSGIGWVTVRNSNHYGIAGFYAMMALDHGCIGISMTNAAVFVVPTFGRDAQLGTNPIAVAAPAGEELPFVLDMATSTVPFGKLEVYDRKEKPIPEGWATDENGNPTTHARKVMDNVHTRPIRGGLSPLGGVGELLGGHKGYGLALLVDVLCGLLPGALYADLVYPKGPGGESLPSGIGHVFGAMNIDAFRPIDEFKVEMDNLQRRLKNAPKAEGQDRIYIHGEKEYEETERRRKSGIPLNPKVFAELQQVADKFGVEFVVE